jgi:hypothetical protein
MNRIILRDISFRNRGPRTNLKCLKIAQSKDFFWHNTDKFRYTKALPSV